MALIIVLSVFNGFENLVISLFNTFNPDLQIRIKEGKTFDLTNIPVDEIKNIPGVISFTEVVEENALLKYQDKQHIVMLKGVSESFLNNNPLDSMMIDGEFILESGDLDFAILGAGVAYFLGVNLQDYTSPVTVYVPSRTRSATLSFEGAFNQKNILPVGVFSVQQDFDIKYVILPLDFTRELLEYEGQLTSIELGLDPDADIEATQDNISRLLGPQFEVRNRFQQQELLYKIMKSEKWVSFLILTFILIIATFNLIGSLSMLILDKKKDIAVLHSMGASNTLIKRIFMTEGMMISMFGGALGLILGGVICWLQSSLGLIRLGAPGGSFVVEYYPVSMQFTDFVFVFLTVFVIGFFSAWLPVHRISGKYLEQKLA